MTESAARDERDRDPTGRARNARPRDRLGRPLPRGATGVPTTPDDLELPPAAALAEAQRLLDADRPFHAHEVLEGTWKATPGEGREFWQGLAQLAVGLTHVGRGRPTGATRLLRRGAERLDPYAADPPHRVPVAQLVSWARALADRIDRDGLAELPPRLLRPTLLPRDSAR